MSTDFRRCFHVFSWTSVSTDFRLLNIYVYRFPSSFWCFPLNIYVYRFPSLFSCLLVVHRNWVSSASVLPSQLFWAYSYFGSTVFCHLFHAYPWSPRLIPTAFCHRFLLLSWSLVCLQFSVRGLVVNRKLKKLGANIKVKQLQVLADWSGCST